MGHYLSSEPYYRSRCDILINNLLQSGYVKKMCKEERIYFEHKTLPMIFADELPDNAYQLSQGKKWAFFTQLIINCMTDVKSRYVSLVAIPTPGTEGKVHVFYIGHDPDFTLDPKRDWLQIQIDLQKAVQQRLSSLLPSLSSKDISYTKVGFKEWDQDKRLTLDNKVNQKMIMIPLLLKNIAWLTQQISHQSIELHNKKGQLQKAILTAAGFYTTQQKYVGHQKLSFLYSNLVPPAYLASFIGAKKGYVDESSERTLLRADFKPF